MIQGRRRQGRRAEARRKKYYTLDTEASTGVIVQRKIMTSKEALPFFKSIHSHYTSEFGICKMADLNLDTSYDVSEFTPEISNMKSEILIKKQSTLLAFSIRYQTDSVTSQLLRAGANASLCLLNEPGMSDLNIDEGLALAVRRRLMELPGAYRTYIANMYVHCTERITPADTLCEALSCTNRGTFLAQPCGHRSCNCCFWERVLECTDESQNAEVTCTYPGCIEVYDIPGKTGSPSVHTTTTLKKLQKTHGTCPSDIAKHSLKLLKALPSSVKELHLLSFNGKLGKAALKASRKMSTVFELEDGTLNMRFRLLSASPRVAATFCLTGSQEMRKDEIARAIDLSYSQRILELVNVGCDVNSRNECGITLLMTAVFGGNIDTVNTLLSVGADPVAVDRLGNTAYDIAVAAGRKDIMELIESFHIHLHQSEKRVSYTWNQEGLGWLRSGRLMSLTRELESDPDQESQPESEPWHGKDSFVLDGAFTEEFLCHLDKIFQEDLASYIQSGCRGNSANNDGAAEVDGSAGDGDKTPTTPTPILAGATLGTDKLAYSDRGMFSDLTGNAVSKTIREVLRHYVANADGNASAVTSVHNELSPPPSTSKGNCDCTVSNVLPSMRFIRYSIDGACSPPHVDLVKTGSAFDFPYCNEIESQPELQSGSRIAVDKTHTRSTHTFILYLTTCITGGQTRLLKKIPSLSQCKKKKSKSKCNRRERVKEASNVESIENDCTEQQNEVVPNKNRIRKRNGNENLEGEKTCDNDVSEDGNDNDNGNVSDSESESDSETQLTPEELEQANTIYAVQPIRGRLLFFPHNHPHEGRPVVLPRSEGVTSQKLILRGEMF
jgi:ankyrin repeat protein